MLCFSSFETLFFLIFLEMCVSFMIFLLFNFSKDSDKSSSLSFMFFTNMVGSIPFMYFCFFCPSSILTYFNFFCSKSILMFFCFSFMLLSKFPIFFFHFWLTKAHVGASGSGSIILASLMLKIGTIGLMKWSFFFSYFFLFFSGYVSVFSLFTSIFLLAVMNRFFDFKYLVACSSIVHMSLIFPFTLLGGGVFLYSSLLGMVGHGVVSCMLFYLVSIFYEFSYSRSLGFNKSVESFSSVFCLILFFWFLMNLGFPPFVSFISEIYFFFCCFLQGSVCSSLFFFILIFSGMFFICLALSIMFMKNNYFFFGSLPLSVLILGKSTIIFFLLLQSII